MTKRRDSLYLHPDQTFTRTDYTNQEELYRKADRLMKKMLAIARKAQEISEQNTERELRRKKKAINAALRERAKKHRAIAKAQKRKEQKACGIDTEMAATIAKRIKSVKANKIFKAINAEDSEEVMAEARAEFIAAHTD